MGMILFLVWHLFLYFMCFVYVITFFGNVVLLSIIFLVRALHTPKYMIVFNLGVSDLCGSTALIPKLLDTFLFENRYIAYNTCLCYFFFVLLFGSMQSWTLALMAYDRFIAICFPLHYHNIMTTPAVSGLLVFVWLLAASVMGTVAGLINRLSFCKSFVIQSFYCDHAALYPLACNSAVLNQRFVVFAGMVMYICPLLVIGGSYTSIAVALKRTVSRGERFKAFKTCSTHLILVTVFFVPLVGSQIAVYFPNYHPNIRMMNFTLSQTVPSLLNPFIYSLKTDEMLTAIKTLFRKYIPRKYNYTPCGPLVWKTLTL
uniref:G-protein coupled receptors family 1 profile domain-containing protein n=1 Tax=Neogobius melanostomus TaxID=47308 RepID=A0A8C6SNN5_9GOBI